MTYQVRHLGTMIEGGTRGLAQGWSPQCLRRPADAAEWGVLKTTAVQSGRFLDWENKALPDDMEPRPLLEVKAGDLLITSAGPRARCGVPALVRDTRHRLMISGKIYRFRVDETAVEPTFVEYYLRSPAAQRAIDSMKTGINESGLNLTKAKFLSLAIPTPELREQRRIVELLDDHLSRIEVAERTLQQNYRRLQTVAAMSRDQAIVRLGAPTVRLGDLLREPLRNGLSAPASRAGSGIRTLTLSAVTHSDFGEHFTKLTTADPERAASLWLKTGDVLIERSNTPELVGTAAMYRGPSNWAIYPDLVIRVRPDETQLLADYLELVLKSTALRNYFRARAKGLSGSMPKVDQATIADARIPLPDIPTQVAAVRETTEVADSTSRLRMAHAQALKRSELLRKSLFTAAFEGKLSGRASDIDRIEELADAAHYAF